MECTCPSTWSVLGTHFWSWQSGHPPFKTNPAAWERELWRMAGGSQSLLQSMNRRSHTVIFTQDTLSFRSRSNPHTHREGSWVTGVMDPHVCALSHHEQFRSWWLFPVVKMCGKCGTDDNQWQCRDMTTLQRWCWREQHSPPELRTATVSLALHVTTHTDLWVDWSWKYTKDSFFLVTLLPVIWNISNISLFIFLLFCVFSPVLELWHWCAQVFSSVYYLLTAHGSTLKFEIRLF